jgi:hypothetical protein
MVVIRGGGANLTSLTPRPSARNAASPAQPPAIRWSEVDERATLRLVVEAVRAIRR